MRRYPLFYEMRRNPLFTESYNADQEIIDADGRVVSICDAAVRGGKPVRLERSERKSPSVEVAYPEYFNSEVVNADGQVVSASQGPGGPSCVQEEHPSMFDGTESADVWKSLR